MLLSKKIAVLAANVFFDTLARRGGSSRPKILIFLTLPGSKNTVYLNGQYQNI